MRSSFNNGFEIRRTVEGTIRVNIPVVRQEVGQNEVEGLVR